MNRIRISGNLEKDGRVFDQGHLYSLRVTRKSGTTDDLLVVAGDGLPEGGVMVTGHLESSYMKGIGVPAYIVPESVEPCEVDNSSMAVFTGVLKSDPVTRRTHGGKPICPILLVSEDGQVPVLLWGDDAGAVEGYSAGDTLTVAGRLQSRGYKRKKDGSRHVTWELSASRFGEGEREDMWT